MFTIWASAVRVVISAVTSTASSVGHDIFNDMNIDFLVIAARH
jgi:hypothetical protein